MPDSRQVRYFSVSDIIMASQLVYVSRYGKILIIIIQLAYAFVKIKKNELLHLEPYL